MLVFLVIGLIVCVAAAITDLVKGTIPNVLTYPLLVLSPLLHVGWGLMRGLPFGEAMLQGGLSLLGIAACGIVPLVMWHKNAIGGGDVKLFAGLGALMLPRLGFEAQLYVFVVAALLAPAHMAYKGTLLRALGNIGMQFLNLFRPKARRKPLDPTMVSWFRLGPCFALGFCVQLLMNWRAP